MNFAKRLKLLRQERELSQDDVAKVLGYKRSSISGYELGRNEPCYQDLCKLADFFGVSVDFLTGKSQGKSIVEEDSIFTESNLSKSEIRDLLKFIKDPSTKKIIAVSKEVIDSGISLDSLLLMIKALKVESQRLAQSGKPDSQG
jgi:transcriptional regulator with XRE-family HTH domain